MNPLGLVISFFLGCGQINSKYKDSEIFPPLSAEKNLYFLMFLVHSNSFYNLSKKISITQGTYNMEYPEFLSIFN